MRGLRANAAFRRYLVWQHRWTGLLTAGFLVVVGITGALLALNPILTRIGNPHLYVADRPGVPRISLGELAARTEDYLPRTQVWFITYQPGRAHAVITPRLDPLTRRACTVGFNSVDLDPYTGKLLGTEGEGCHANSSHGFMALVYNLHINLAGGPIGAAILGYVALVWTIDCLVGFYLTLPLTADRFWSRWRLAWRIDRRKGPIRFNFDLHRSGGLWLWPLLFIFAWSSVQIARSDVYNAIMRKVFTYKDDTDLVSSVPVKDTPSPRIGWRMAQSIGDRLFVDLARREHVDIRGAQALSFISHVDAYSYAVRTGDSFRHEQPDAFIWFSAEDGRLLQYFPARGTAGRSISHFLTAAHLGDLYGEPWRYVEAVFGVLIALLSITGVVVWLHKRRARRRKRVFASQ